MASTARCGEAFGDVGFVEGGLGAHDGGGVVGDAPLATQRPRIVRALPTGVRAIDGLFQLIGTAINHLLLPVLPGPIIGLLLMLGYLIWRGEVGEPLSLAASSLLRYLPLLLVPPAVGFVVVPPRYFYEPQTVDQPLPAGHPGERCGCGLCGNPVRRRRQGPHAVLSWL